MTSKRSSPYVWVTWITGLLSGDSHCEWAAWFKAHHVGYAKRQTGFNLIAWKGEHGGMVRKVAGELRESGYTVYVESQNKFAFEGRNGVTLAGTPDIVAVRGDEVLVVDCKTGKRRGSDAFQVLLYMLVLPLTHHACRGKKVTGRVAYTDGDLTIYHGELSSDIRELIRIMVSAVGGPNPAPKVPSYDECQWCDLTVADCPERVEEAPASTNAENSNVF